MMDNLFQEPNPADPVLRVPVPCTQNKEEIEWLITQVRMNQEAYTRNPRGQMDEDPMHILEIGTFFGGTLYCWAKAFPDAAIYAIDDYHGIDVNPYPVPHFDTKPSKADLVGLWRSWGSLELNVWFDKSQDVLAKLLEQGPGWFDFAFIDGDHSYEGVRDDFLAARGLVRSSGLIAFHDIVNYEGVPENDVQTFWEDLKAGKFGSYATKEFIADPKWMGIGIVQI